MNKKFTYSLILALSIIISAFFASCNETANLPTPNLVSFEKQQVLTSYDWNLISLNGNTMSLISKENQLNFIHFWDAKSETYDSELKEFNKLYDVYKSKLNFIVVTNNEQPFVRDYLESNSYYFPVYYSLSPVPIPLQPISSSRSYLISKKGRIVVDNKGLVDWSSQDFKKLLDGLLKQ